MKKIIRLTEADLTRIVKRVIQEQEFNEGKGGAAMRDSVGRYRNQLLEIMKKLYLKYKRLGRNGIRTNTTKDPELLQLQNDFNENLEFFNPGAHTGITKTQKGFNLKDGIFGPEAYAIFNEVLSYLDNEWYQQNKF